MIPKYSCGTDDITFCIDACDETCYRHPNNIIDKQYPHSMAYLKGTDMCHKTKEEKTPPMTSQEVIDGIKEERCNYLCDGFDSCEEKDRCWAYVTIKELERAKSFWGDDFDGWYERYKSNFLALNDYVTIADKYKWHDLRKNPDDLPENTDNLLAIVDIGSIKHDYRLGLASYFIGDEDPYKWEIIRMGELMQYPNVIAWAYIPPFESEVEE